MGVLSGILIRAIRSAITPCSARIRGVGDASEFGKHDGLIGIRLTLEQQQTTARAFSLEQPRYLLRAVTLGNALRLVVVIVNADNIGRDTFPAIISDHRARGIKRLG